MRAVLSFLVNMLPYMILTIPVFLIVRFIINKKKDNKVNWYREFALFLFIICVVGLASQTIIPKFEFGVNGFNFIKNGIHNTNLIPFKVLFETYHEVFINGYVNYFIINFLGNIIMFMPFGFFIPLLWNISNKKIILIGFCSSLFIEISQLFLTRGTDVDDLILNTLGVFIGSLVFNLLNKKANKLLAKFK